MQCPVLIDALYEPLWQDISRLADRVLLAGIAVSASACWPAQDLATTDTGFQCMGHAPAEPEHGSAQAEMSDVARAWPAPRHKDVDRGCGPGRPQGRTVVTGAKPRARRFFRFPRRGRVRFAARMSPPDDLTSIPRADLEALVIRLPRVLLRLRTADGHAKSLKRLSWLGDLDSNQGFPSQSRKFYR